MEAFEKDVCFSTFPFYGRAFLLAPRVYSDRIFPLSKDWNIVTGHRWLNPSKMLFIYSTEYVSEFASLHNEGLTKVKHPRRPVGIFRLIPWRHMRYSQTMKQRPNSWQFSNICKHNRYTSFPRVIISQLTYNKDIDKANIFVILLAHYIVVSNFFASSFFPR